MTRSGRGVSRLGPGTIPARAMPPARAPHTQHCTLAGVEAYARIAADASRILRRGVPCVWSRRRGSPLPQVRLPRARMLASRRAVCVVSEARLPASPVCLFVPPPPLSPPGPLLVSSVVPFLGSLCNNYTLRISSVSCAPF